MLRKLYNDEAGAILSAELVLIGTIAVLGVLVGLVELQCSIVDELNDLGEAFGSLNQSYTFAGVQSEKEPGVIKGAINGSIFVDNLDQCDGNECQIVCVNTPLPEAPKQATP